MNELIQQIKWQFILLHRNNFITISIVVTAMYAIIFFAIRDLGNTDKVLTLLILNDPAIIGLFFIGLSVITEKDQQVLTALFVTPISHHIYLLSRVLSLSIIGWGCALGMGFAAVGTSFHFIHFSAGVFGICLLSSLAGAWLVCYTQEFMRFVLMSIPVLLIFVNLPLLNYFEVTDIGLFRIMPAQGSLTLIAASHGDALAVYSNGLQQQFAAIAVSGGDSPTLLSLVYGYASIVFWVPLCYWFVYRTFIFKIVNR